VRPPEAPVAAPPAAARITIAGARENPDDVKEIML
jgi:hypothetical protein